MRIIRQIAASAVLLSFCFSVSVKPSQANPAVLAPVAFCAGTAGAGCVLIGAVAIAGTIYYVWEYGDTQAIADSSGQIFQASEEEITEHYVSSPEKCYEMEKKYGWKLVQPPRFVGNGLLPWQCKFSGDAKFPNYKR